MIPSQARVEANRQNAQKSTGPKTPEGKARSRANAFKHGLCASVVVSDEEKQARVHDDELAPTTINLDWLRGWLSKQAKLMTCRIERAQEMERLTRHKVATRARVCWDDDRKLEAALLGEQIGEEPEIVVYRLLQTLHGCEWMMSRWALLAYTDDLHKSWTPDQTRLALNLLATPLEFREGHEPGTKVDPDGRIVEVVGDRAAIARQQIDALKARCTRLAPLNETSRSLAETDLNDDFDPEVRRLRRYELDLNRRLRWFLARLADLSEISEPDQSWSTHPPEPVQTASTPVSMDEIPFTVGRSSASNGPSTDVPSPDSRLDKKLKQAESRREARLRKLGKRRA